MFQFTTMIGVDVEHLEELRVVWPTWMKHRPEIAQNRMVVIMDDDVLLDTETGGYYSDPAEAIPFVDHPRMTIKVVNREKSIWKKQREFMLSHFITTAPKLVKTKWFLKLDTDVVAAHGGKWWDEEWFRGDTAFVASPWGYTKPAWGMGMLDSWAEGRSEFANTQPLDIEYDVDTDRTYHSRIISYVYWGRTDWHKQMGKLFHRHSPVEVSHDGYFWYCAERLGVRYLRKRMAEYGWRHINGLERLKAAASKV